MASHVYPSAKALFLTAGLDLSSLTIEIILLTSAYTYNAAHDFRDDLTGVIATSGALASKTTTSGVFDAADITFTAVTTGSTIASLVGCVIRGGASSADNLLFFVDGFSQVTNGGDIVVAWDNTAGLKIFAL